MNERIQELVSATGYILESNREQTGMPVEDDFVEKFVELFVRECAVIVGSMEEPHQDIAKLIKQHFGVEE